MLSPLPVTLDGQSLRPADVVAVAAEHDGESRYRRKEVLEALTVRRPLSAAAATGRAHDQGHPEAREDAREFHGMVVELIHAESEKVGEHHLDDGTLARESQPLAKALVKSVRAERSKRAARRTAGRKKAA